MNSSEQRLLAGAALVTGACVPGFIAIFGLWTAAGLGQQAAADPVQVAAFALEHRVLYAALPLLGVAMHLAALLLVVGLHPRLEARAPLLMKAATVLGLSWVTIDLLQNLVHYQLFVGGMTAEVAGPAGRMADAIWHSGHLGGGVWVTAVGLAGAQVFGRGFRVMSVLAGTSFFLHPFVVPLVPEYFGVEMVLVPIWAFWLAGALFKRAATPAALAPAAAT